MPWLEFKNGLLLKLASILQFLSARLTPEVQSPGLQEGAHLQMEDDLSAFSKKRFKVSRPSEGLQKENGRKPVDEGPIGDVSRPVGERFVRERPLSTERHTAIEPVRKIEERRHGLVPASSSS